ncbi:MAG TPA: hypothetical protein VJL32_02585, partial [Candidatus Paceibacterota bacterium]
RMVLNKNPEIISADKTLTFKELRDFKNINNAVNYLIDREIDNSLYGGHLSQIVWFEKKLNVEIIRYISDILSIFIEMTERRNLFMHADGIVNNRYLSICKQNGVVLGREIKIGSQLGMSSEYLRSVHDCFYEISAKITYILWRKINPRDNKSGEVMFNNKIVVGLIKRKKYDLAYRLADFAINYFQDSDDVNIKLFHINRALAKKLKGEEVEAISLINRIDWEGSRDEFRLARDIIINNFKEALVLMKRIGKKGEIIRQQNYESDPIFIPIRELPEFINLFKKIYREDYITSETRTYMELIGNSISKQA